MLMLMSRTSPMQPVPAGGVRANALPSSTMLAYACLPGADTTAAAAAAAASSSSSSSSSSPLPSSATENVEGARL